MLNIPEYPEASSFFRFFEEISSIPHGSGNTSHIAEYLVNFATSRGLAVMRDGINNVIIKKPATKGLEDRRGVVLQAHLDMVADKTADCTIDMTTEGLSLYRDGDFIKARGTTLGGDDGIGVAYALAILDADDIPHPPLEALFTSDEEIGLIGATGLRGDEIDGRMLINLDLDSEGIFTVGCAGGMRSDIKLPVKRESADGVKYLLSLDGCQGGHSGGEINKGRVNAIKALGEILALSGGLRIVSISGGVADNAIPKSAECELIISDKERVLSAIAEIREKYKEAEPDISITLTASGTAHEAVDTASSERIVDLLSRVPSGVIAMSADMPTLVETSLNLGIIKMDEEVFNCTFSVRSSIGEKKKAVGARLHEIADGFGADYSERGEYPAWEYKKNSPLRDTMVRVYERMYNKSPKVIIIHAGLECGILSEKYEGLDSVSMGPDNFDIHTPDERMSISSVARVWNYLLEVLKEI